MLLQINDTIIHLSTVRETLKGALEKERRSKKKERRYTSDRETQYEIPNQRGTDVIIEGIWQ